MTQKFEIKSIDATTKEGVALVMALALINVLSEAESKNVYEPLEKVEFLINKAFDEDEVSHFSELLDNINAHNDKVEGECCCGCGCEEADEDELTVEDIDSTTSEGKTLLAAIGVLTLTSKDFMDKTPDETLRELFELACESFPDEDSEEK